MSISLMYFGVLKFSVSLDYFLVQKNLTSSSLGHLGRSAHYFSHRVLGLNLLYQTPGKLAGKDGVIITRFRK